VANAGVRGRPIEPLVLSAQERTKFGKAGSSSSCSPIAIRAMPCDPAVCRWLLPSKSVAAELDI
jgi:hypothetical protein